MRSVTTCCWLMCLLLAGCAGRLEFLGELLLPRTVAQEITVAGESLSVVSFTTGDEVTAKPVLCIGGSGCASECDQVVVRAGTFLLGAP